MAESSVCVAVYMPHGIDLRLLEAATSDGPNLNAMRPSIYARSAERREKLLAAGWTVDVTSNGQEPG